MIESFSLEEKELAQWLLNTFNGEKGIHIMNDRWLYLARDLLQKQEKYVDKVFSELKINILAELNQLPKHRYTISYIDQAQSKLRSHFTRNEHLSDLPKSEAFVATENDSKNEEFLTGQSFDSSASVVTIQEKKLVNVEFMRAEFLTEEVRKKNNLPNTGIELLEVRRDCDG